MGEVAKKLARPGTAAPVSESPVASKASNGGAAVADSVDSSGKVDAEAKLDYQPDREAGGRGGGGQVAKTADKVVWRYKSASDSEWKSYSARASADLEKGFLAYYSSSEEAHVSLQYAHGAKNYTANFRTMTSLSGVRK